MSSQNYQKLNKIDFYKSEILLYRGFLLRKKIIMLKLIWNKIQTRFNILPNIKVKIKIIL